MPTGVRRIRLGAVGLVVVGAMGAITLVALSSGRAEHALGPVLNEVAVGGSRGWVELHNPTGRPVDLAGWFLSDDDDRLDRWRIPDVVLDPGAHIVVFASGQDRRDPAGELHTDFRIARDGEPVLLVEPDGTTVADRFPPVQPPVGASFGRDPRDPSRTCFFAFPTPGDQNAPECFDDDELGAPAFSATSGFFDDPFELTITAEGADQILYTLDGSYPDLDANPDRTHVYGEPLRIADRSGEPNTISVIDTSAPTTPAPPPLAEPVQKATVVRARTAHSAERVATFFVGAQLRRDGLPVLSLVLPEEYLFDHDTGIYVAGRTFTEYRSSADADPRLGWRTPANYHQRGRDWERPFADDLRPAVVLEHCGVGGSCDYQTQLGVRTQGNFGRALPHKSLRLYARTDYGAREFTYPFFGDAAPAVHRRLILRNSGNDAGGLLLIDGYLQSLMTHFQADTQAYQPAVLFINGEYWGIHNIRERYDRHYLEQVHGADPDRVVLLGPRLEVASGDPDGAAPFHELLAFVASADPSDLSFLERVESEVDLDSFIDFLVAHISVGNADWPGNNTRMWREPDGPDAIGDGVRDGRWHWMIFDLDLMGGGLGRFAADFDVFTGRMAPTTDPEHESGIPLLFHRLMEAEGFRDRFLQRFADHLNTTFDPGRALAQLDVLEALLAEEIALHGQRWGTPSSVEAWRGDLDRLRGFMQERPGVQRNHLVELAGLDGTANLTVRVEPDAGSVRVNSIDIVAGTPGVVDPASWHGIYFRGIPVVLEAVPAAGHRFVRWEGLPDADATSPRLRLVLDGDVTVDAVFTAE